MDHYLGSMNRNVFVELIKSDARFIICTGLGLPDGKSYIFPFYLKQGLKFQQVIVTGIWYVCWHTGTPGAVIAWSIYKGGETGFHGVEYFWLVQLNEGLMKGWRC